MTKRRGTLGVKGDRILRQEAKVIEADRQPGSALSTENAALPNRIRQQFSAREDALRTWLWAALKTGRKQGKVRAEGKMEDQAEPGLATLHGGTPVTRASSNPKAFDRALKQLKAILLIQGTLNRVSTCR